MLNKTVGVVGGGLMGAGIAAKFALAGYETIVLEADDARVLKIPTLIQDILTELTEAGLFTSEFCQASLARVAATSDLIRLKNVDVVIEAIPEVLEMKLDLYEKLESVLSVDALIASNTSGYLPDALCTKMIAKERFLIAHFWNPPHTVPLVEVVPGSATSAKSLERMVEILRDIEAEPVVLKSAIPGFIGNRIQFAVLREALNIVRSGAADAKTVDAVMKASLGRRYSMVGPFEGADLGGLGTFLAIASHLMPQLGKDEDVLDVLRSYTEKGHLGASTGEGFYRWDKERLMTIKEKRRQQLVDSRKNRVKSPG